MQRFLCTTKHYNLLYSRYLQNPEKLLQLANYNVNHDLLDLCGGTGAISLSALKLGADPSRITLIDLNPRCEETKINQLKGHALHVMEKLSYNNKVFDIIVCRQAFAYLTIEGKAGEKLAKTISTLIKPGGCFIFNSFIRPSFKLKIYCFTDQYFIELAGYFKRKIFRLQINLSKGCDLTISKWHREERIFEIFNPYFSIVPQWSNNAIYWILKRRNKDKAGDFST